MAQEHPHKGAKENLNDQRTRKKEEISEKDRKHGMPGIFKNDPDKDGETGKTSTAPNPTKQN